MTTKLQFGLMTGTDEKILLETMELVNNEFPQGVINTTEVGVRRGESSRAIHQFFTDKGRINFHTGLDNEHDVKDGCPFEGCRFLVGSSIDIFTEIPNDTQHFVFLDACHNYAYSMIDLLLYSEKVRIGGFLAMHDTSPYIKPFQDFQGLGNKFHPDMFISCRKALKRLGVYNNKFEGFELIFDEADPHAMTGGLTVIKRIS